MRKIKINIHMRQGEVRTIDAYEAPIEYDGLKFAVHRIDGDPDSEHWKVTEVSTGMGIPVHARCRSDAVEKARQAIAQLDAQWGAGHFGGQVARTPKIKPVEEA